MEVLRDIAKLSNYRPNNGLKLELFSLANEQHFGRLEAAAHFEKQGKKGQFLVVYKRLKDALLEGITDDSFKNLPTSSQIKFRLWKKHLQTKILILAGRKTAGIKLAIETITIAEKLDQFEIVQSLCKRLIQHYSSIQPNFQKFHKYQTKLNHASAILYDEMKAISVYYDLILCYNKGKSINHLPTAISELKLIALNNNHYKFRFYYYSIINIYAQITNEQEKVIHNNRKAYQFFSKQKKILPYIYKFNFLVDIIPIYLLKKKFADTETTLRNCLTLPPPNSFNHHKTLIYQALLGFHSNKPKIAQHAYKVAHAKPTKFDSTVIDQRWHLIKGYLALYHKLGLIQFDQPFRLKSFLNIPEAQGNHNQKANLIILELLHLLVDKEYTKFYAKLERVEAFISKRFKAHEYKRTRYFLRMMKAVTKGNYHGKLVLAHAERQSKLLVKSTESLNVDTIEREIAPYEILWDLVIKQLR